MIRFGAVILGNYVILVSCVVDPCDQIGTFYRLILNILRRYSIYITPFVASAHKKQLVQGSNIHPASISFYLKMCLRSLDFFAPYTPVPNLPLQCHTCRKPYFGGLVSCEPSAPPGGSAGVAGAGAEARVWGSLAGQAGEGMAEMALAERSLADVKPQELLCGKCSAGSGGANCSEHGQV